MYWLFQCSIVWKTHIKLLQTHRQSKIKVKATSCLWESADYHHDPLHLTNHFFRSGSAKFICRGQIPLCFFFPSQNRKNISVVMCVRRQHFLSVCHSGTKNPEIPNAAVPAVGAASRLERLNVQVRSSLNAHNIRTTQQHKEDRVLLVAGTWSRSFSRPGGGWKVARVPFSREVICWE